MIDKIMNFFLGSKHDRDLKALIPIVAAVNDRENWAMAFKDEELPGQTALLKERYTHGESLDSLLPEAFALARETARRVLRERPYDVQIMGGAVLHQGKIMEMKTGEGKTLSLVAPAYLNGLTGEGVHIVTVNDYLAERDAKWMGPVFRTLGLSVGVILSHMDPEARQKEYACDITYGTNNEFGFDYLRDNMRFDMKLKTQTRHNYCIIDEIDSILIDEARTPLIISGSVEDDTDKIVHANSLSIQLNEVEKDPETGEYPVEDPLQKTVLKGDYKLDPKGKRVTFTEDGINSIEGALTKRSLITGSIYDGDNFEYVHYFTQAIRARYLYHPDVDYVIREGKVEIVDEFTGRILEGRRYSEGLHQAIEAKENIKIAHRNRTLATITFQKYFMMYGKLSGMTGTADTEAREFGKIYDLDVVVLPTNRPLARIDADDSVYLNEDAKYKAICDEIKKAHEKGQPVLVGTVSVEKSEILSAHLKKRRIPHEILNAKNHSREALIIAEAGAVGAVTVATNMAGRGTDIKLGGNPETRARRKLGNEASEEEFLKVLGKETEKWKTENAKVKELGGLFVLGTERHESRRIDNQLRGRSGRQGDPGYSKFFISFDDELMRLFGGERLKSMMSRFGMTGDEPLPEHKMVNSSIQGTQKKVENRNYEIRKHLLEYDEVLNNQRSQIYTLRDEVLTSNALIKKVQETGEEILSILAEDYDSDAKSDTSTALARFQERCLQNFGTNLSTEELLEHKSHDGDALAEAVKPKLAQNIHEKIEIATEEVINHFIRYDYLRHIDIGWQEHLEQMESLREAVYLRSYAQKNPLVEYKREGFEIFDNMVDSLRIAMARKLFRVKISAGASRQQHGPALLADKGSHRQMGSFAEARNQESSTAQPANMQVRRAEPKVGRNDPCPCGSGKKYKHCHGG